MSSAFRFGRFELQPDRRTLLVDGHPTTMGQRAFDVLLTLVERAPQLVTKNELFDLVWPGVIVEENNLHVQLSSVRKVLGTDSITTIAGRGYRFSLPVTIVGPHPLPQSKEIGPSTRLNNLPEQLSTFIGRDEEVLHIKDLLRSTHLLTLTGSGGAGKTRLALRVGADLIEQFSHGAWFIDLAPLNDPTLVTRTIAGVIGVREASGQPLEEALGNYLSDKQILMILDNCEQLIDTCALKVEGLLRRCAALKILATSREALHCAGETTYRVPSLNAPDPQGLPPLEQLKDYEAVQLFVERAVSTGSSFCLTEQNALAVAQICHRLDGIPLAIELAAARAKAISVDVIAQRLDDRFQLLTTGVRSGLPRYRTLRATIDWSYSLLSPAEATLFRRVAVFAGSWDIEATEVVCADPAPTDGAMQVLSAPQILDLIDHLVDKSMVLADMRQGVMRYRMLETIRQYGREKLRESSEEATLQARHFAHYFALAEEAGRQVQGAGQLHWLDRLEVEHDNVRAALDWTIVDSRSEAGLQLGASLCYFWVTRGYLSEARQRLLSVLRHHSQVSASAGRANALLAAGEVMGLLGHTADMRPLFDEGMGMLRALGTHGDRLLGSALARYAYALVYCDYDRARELAEEGMAVSRAYGDRIGLATSLEIMWYVSLFRCEFVAAHAYLREAEGTFRALQDRGRLATALGNFGTTYMFEGKLPEAEGYLLETLQMSQDISYRRGFAYAMRGLGVVATQQGQFEDASLRLQQSLAVSRELGDSRGLTMVLFHLSQLELARRNYADAAKYVTASLVELVRCGFTFWLPGVLEASAACAVSSGEFERAARRLGAATAMREAAGTPMFPAYRANHHHWVGLTQAGAGADTFAAAFAQGRTLTTQAAIDDALAVDLRVPPTE